MVDLLHELVDSLFDSDVGLSRSFVIHEFVLGCEFLGLFRGDHPVFFEVDLIAKEDGVDVGACVVLHTLHPPRELIK